MARWVTLVLFAAALSFPAHADEMLDAALVAYRSLDYENAVALLEKARETATSTDDKVRIARTMAFCQVALGDSVRARAEFRTLLELAPSTQLDDSVSPRVRAIFEEARAGQDMVELALHPPLPQLLEVIAAPLRPRDGEPLTLRWNAGDGVTAELLYRARGESQYAKVSARPNAGKFEVPIPGLLVRSPAVEYYLVEHDQAGNAVGIAGAEDKPLAIEVAARPRPRPVYKRAWFWGAVGGSVAAAGIAASVVGVIYTRPAHLTIQHP
jgi:hypothetical protein